MPRSRSKPKETGPSRVTDASLESIVTGQLIPWVEEFGASRLLLAREPVSTVAALPGVRIRKKPMRGQEVKVRGPGVRGQLQSWWCEPGAAGPAGRGFLAANWREDLQAACRFPYCVFVLAGEAHLRLGDAIVECEAGYGLLVPTAVPMSGGPHWERTSFEHAYSDIFWLQLRPAGMQYYLCGTRGNVHLDPGTGEKGFVAGGQFYMLYELLLAEMAGRLAGHDLLGKSYLLSMLTLLRRYLASDAAPGRAELARYAPDLKDPASRSWAVARAREYINNHLHQHLTLQEIARSAFISRSSLAELFRAETGSTVWDYVTSRRIEEAKVLLRSSDLSIREIGAIVGFPQLTHFCARFTQATGQPPSNFRRKTREMTIT